MNIDALQFDEKGLIPAVVQDAGTGQVLTLAYMNKESLAITLEEGHTCFWSRSRGQLWRKGETSGNVQRVVSVTADCDADALVVKVLPAGPACHTGAASCFYNTLWPAGGGEGRAVGEGRATGEEQPGAAAGFSLEGLYELLRQRRAAPKEGSYTSYLFAKGLEKILKKVGEESAEVLIAAMKGERQETIFEVADLCYHVMVLMVQMDIAPAQIREELAGRHVVDKKTKQEPLR